MCLLLRAVSEDAIATREWQQRSILKSGRTTPDSFPLEIFNITLNLCEHCYLERLARNDGIFHAEKLTCSTFLMPLETRETALLFPPKSIAAEHIKSAT